MKPLMTIVLALTLVGSAAQATILQDWQMNDGSETDLKDLNNSAGTAYWNNTRTNMVTDGAGNLSIKAGSQNYYNNTQNNMNLTTGIYELEFKYSSFDLTNAGNALMGFGLRDTGSSQEMTAVRLDAFGSDLKLKWIAGGNPATTLYNFGATTTTMTEGLVVRQVVDLDNDTINVYYKLGTNPEVHAIMNASMIAEVVELDAVRFHASTSGGAFGVGDVVNVDYVTLSQIPEPATLGLIGMTGLTVLFVRRRVIM